MNLELKLSMQNNKLSFIKVLKNKKKHIDALYILFNLRKYRISSSNTSLSEHTKFVKENPYRIWYIIYLSSKEPIGSIYLTKNNKIGINLIKYINKKNISEILQFIKKNHKPLKEIKSVRAGLFSINVPKSNIAFQKFLKEIDLKVSQVTFNLSAN